MHEILRRTAEHVRQQQSADCTGHDWWHTDRVRRTALALAAAEGADPLVVELAALLHDIADWKFHDGDTAAGPRAARAWLVAQQVEPAIIEHVCRIVGSLSFRGAGVPTPMDSLEGGCVQDADRLDALGAIGVARAFAYGAVRGQPLYDPEAPPAPHGSFAEYRRGGSSTINHFHEKLLLLADRMNTATGRALAAGRHAFLERFLAEFQREWEGTDLPPAP